MARPSSAAPWIDRVATIEATSDQVLSWSEPPAPRRIWAEVAAFDGALRGLGTLFADALPLPVPATADDPEVAEAVERVLVSTFEDAEPPAAAVDTAREAGRLGGDTADGRDIPLATVGEPVANWFVVVPVVAERIEEAAARVERCAGRLELHGRDDSAAALRDVSGALRDTATTVRNVATRTLWLNPPDGLVDANERQVREYVTRTMNAYNPVA
ncbi:hypothetical protein [Halobaculum gomorrense]|uniref:Uncharacterized protein n=1 Tax=Halobaculum gomorrense TaxID=43928 RepID=A0A1M5NUY4_9EURY|nr:hypothetical protein [Halobaculum gomorrense]SHG93265.1 hypothetical protein SAMN05443636_1353 [Halobaculum gomorrense]